MDMIEDAFIDDNETQFRDDEIEQMDVNMLADYSVDFVTIDDNCRRKVIEFFCQTYPMHSIEAVNKLVGMYVFSRIKVLEKFLYLLCVNSKLKIDVKLVLANGLCTSGLEIGYDAMEYLCRDLGDTPTPIKVESVVLLMECEKYKNESLGYFNLIINDWKLTCDFRYKTILRLEMKELENKKYFLTEALKAFFFCDKNLVTYRILSAQYLRQNLQLSDDDVEAIENDVLGFARDTGLDYNVRADAADLLLRLGMEEKKKQARTIIRDLGVGGLDEKNKRTIYENAQNVHIIEIEQSAIEAIEYMFNNQPQELVKKTCFQGVKKEIDDYFKNAKVLPSTVSKEDVEFALNRIFLDRALYSKYNCTLESVLVRIWIEISSSENRDEMFIRLLQELTEMSGTCSTGYIIRLVNCISGFGLDFGIRISYRDQLVANFLSRFNQKLINIPEEMKPEIGYFMIKQFLSYRTQKSSRVVFEDQDEIELIYLQKYSDLQTTRNEDWELDFYKNIISLDDCIVEFQTQTIDDISSNRSPRSFFNFFLIKVYSELYKELSTEFESYISKDEFSVYFEAAILHYENQIK